MTIDFTKPCQSSTLIHDSRLKFFPTKITPQHSQLKNYLSTRSNDVLYYASDNDIYALHLLTRKKRLITRLDWKPFCLDAGYGWLCAGYKHGKCALLKVGDFEIGLDAPKDLFEVDDLLPLNLDPESRASHDSTWTPPTPPRPQLFRANHVSHFEFGKVLINSVKIQLMRGGPEQLEEEIVAITTHNDKTVRIFSISRYRNIAELSFPIDMNHATISPDGTMMMAVGDYDPEKPQPQIFFHRKVIVPSELPDPEYAWQPIAKTSLSGSCFTTAFSPSGHICATASQCGYITMYDTSLIVDDRGADDATIAVLHSSRGVLPAGEQDFELQGFPGGPGAVRSMSFSPAPWDLLAWAEDQGKVCVVDLRNGIGSIQTLRLDSSSSDLTRVELLEHEDNILEQREHDIMRRYVDSHREALEAQRHLAAVSHTADYMEHAAERRRRERDLLNSEFQSSRDTPDRLSDSERQMIDSIGLRRGAPNENRDPPPPVTVNYNSNRTGTDPQMSTWLTPPSLASTLQSRSTASIAEYMRQRNLERSRTTDRTYQPRRRSSVVISNSNSNSANSSSSNPVTSLTPIGTATPTLSTSPARLPSATPPDDNTSSSEQPWHTITAATGADYTNPDAVARMRRIDSNATSMRTLERQRSARENHTRPNMPQPTSREPMSQAQLQDYQLRIVLDAQRERRGGSNSSNVLRLRQLSAAIGRGELYDDEHVTYFRRPSPEAGVITMGIGWGPYGRHLYVACEEGIFEYEVNIEGRMQFPGASFM